MLELAILGLLTEESLHGYELKKQLADTLGFASGVSFGSLYPALGRLEAAGAVEAVGPCLWPPGPAGPAGGEASAPRSRRGKKVYRITPSGRTVFEELLAAESNTNDDDRIFALRLAFARYLLPDVRLGMLERRRARLVERLARLGVRVRSGVDRLDGYGRTLAEHDRDIAEHDLTWIDQLIASERAAATGERPAPGAGPRGSRRSSIPTHASNLSSVPSISALRRLQSRNTATGRNPVVDHREDPTP